MLLTTQANIQSTRLLHAAPVATASISVSSNPQLGRCWGREASFLGSLMAFNTAGRVMLFEPCARASSFLVRSLPVYRAMSHTFVSLQFGP